MPSSSGSAFLLKIYLNHIQLVLMQKKNAKRALPPSVSCVRVVRWSTPGLVLIWRIESASLQLQHSIEREEDQVRPRAMHVLSIAL